MYKIAFKGIKDAVYVSDVKGRELKNDWLNGTLPPKIELEEMAIVTSDIKYVQANVHPEINKEKVKTQNEEHGKEVRREYFAERKKRLDLSTEERAKDLRLAQLVFWAVSETAMPKEAEQEFINRQKVFFDENPKLSLANPICYKDVMRRFYKKTSEEFETRLRGGVMCLVERMLSEDKFSWHLLP